MPMQRPSFVVLLILSACARDAGTTPAASGDDASVLDASTADARAADASEPDASPPIACRRIPPETCTDPIDAGVTDPPSSTQDQCYSASCVPSALPEQEDLEFLEDMGDGWLRLLEADWEVAPTAEGYRCMTFTIPEDVFITAFYPQVPPGTHHATFAVNDTPTGPDQVVACGVGVGGDRRLQGAGAGSEPSELPQGVVQALRAGQQVTMNLHLFNVTEQVLRGRSGLWVKTIPEDQVVHESETILAGPLALNVPVGASTQLGQCTLGADATLYSVGPHMHQLGVHMRAVALTADGEVELHDGPYDFTHQVSYPIEPLELAAGDIVRIECSYENDTDSPVSWGDSSLDEMCFIALNVYPASGLSGGGPCTH